MSLIQSASYVPEILLEAPGEIEDANVTKQLQECAGVAFIRLYRLGCIVTVRGGQGIVMKKRSDSTFGAPLAVTMLGPGLGASIGVQVSNIMLFFKTEELVDAFVQNVGTFGINGSLGAGTIGREGEAIITTATHKAGILAFSSTKGLYGGVSIEFSGLIPDKPANQSFYGADIDFQDILSVTPPPTGEPFDKMYKYLYDCMKQPLSKVNEIIEERKE